MLRRGGTPPRRCEGQGVLVDDTFVPCMKSSDGEYVQCLMLAIIAPCWPKTRPQTVCMRVLGRSDLLCRYPWHLTCPPGTLHCALLAQAERDVVSRAEARVAFDAGDHARAAQLWGAMRGAVPSFDEVALRFVGAGATDALQAFLMARLQVLGPDDKAQVREDSLWRVWHVAVQRYLKSCQASAV